MCGLAVFPTLVLLLRKGGARALRRAAAAADAHNGSTLGNQRLVGQCLTNSVSRYTLYDMRDHTLHVLYVLHVMHIA